VGFKEKIKQSETDHERTRLALETDYSKWQSASASVLRTIQQWIHGDVALRTRLRTTEIEHHITDDFLRAQKQLNQLKIELTADANHYVLVRPLSLTPRVEGAFGRIELEPSSPTGVDYYLDWDGKLDSPNCWWFRSSVRGFDKRLNSDSLNEILGELFNPQPTATVAGLRRRERERESDQTIYSVDFSFIASAKLRSIAARDWDECQRAFKSKCWKSVLILAGGLVETILLSQLARRKKRALKTKAASGASTDLTRWDLSRLIRAARELKIVPPAVEALPEPLRQYRNLAHPGNEMREKLKFGEPDATTAFHALRAILAGVSGSSVTEDAAEQNNREADPMTRAPSGWLGVEWNGKFLAYDGPYENLKLIEDRGFDMSMQEALQAGGYRVAAYDKGHFGEIGGKVHFVLLTDRTSWRCRVVAKGDAYLVASPI
jgi:hypothetical protein